MEILTMLINVKKAEIREKFKFIYKKAKGGINFSLLRNAKKILKVKSMSSNIR